MAALRSAFQRAGLPDPPDINGADPIPVGVALGLAQAWADAGAVAALGKLGRVYQALEDHEAALRCFVPAARLDSDDVRWWYGVGAECQAMGLIGPGIDALERAGRLDPDYPTTYARLGALHLDAGDLDRAETSYEQYRKREPGISLGYVGLGRVALARGEPAKAQRLLRTAVEKTPNDFLAHRLLGRALAANGMVELARHHESVAGRLEQYSGWLVFDPRLQESQELADTQRHLANQMRLAVGSGRYEAAARFAVRLVERRPKDHKTLGNLAAVYRELGRLDEAQQTVNQALALKPDSAGLRCTRAEIIFSRQDYVSTHREIDAALALDPQLARAFELRGRTFFMQGEYDEAIAGVTEALALAPASIDTRYLLATMYRLTRRTGDAVRTLEALLELDPTHVEARGTLNELKSPTPRPGGRGG